MFITGGAGTGKSHILEYYREKKKFIKLGPTGKHSLICPLNYSLTRLLVGVSAANIEGMTYFSKLKFIPYAEDKTSYANLAFGNDKNIGKIKLNRYHQLDSFHSYYFYSLIHRDSVLVFDEVSMISGETLDLINYLICKKMQRDGLEFNHSFISSFYLHLRAQTLWGFAGCIHW